LRFGSLTFPNAGVRNVRIGGDVYDVSLADGVKVRRNGDDLLECTARTIVRLPLSGPPSAPIEIVSRSAGRLIVLDAEWVGGTQRPARVNGQAQIKPRSAGPKTLAYVWGE
ncbi:MAG: hypothetical protein ACPMAQ_12400, partial [Phycisphaerae bacterium]